MITVYGDIGQSQVIMHDRTDGETKYSECPKALRRESLCTYNYGSKFLVLERKFRKKPWRGYTVYYIVLDEDASQRRLSSSLAPSM